MTRFFFIPHYFQCRNALILIDNIYPICNSLSQLLTYFLLNFSDNVELEESKSLFETNYSHVYFILYDTFIQAEANLKQKGKSNEFNPEINIYYEPKAGVCTPLIRYY